MSTAHASPATVTPSFPIRLGIFLGIAVGFVEALVRLVERFFLGRTLRGAWPDVLWMAPTASLFVFGLAGIALFLAARWWPRLFSFTAITGMLGFLAFAGLTLLYPKIHQGAALILALGLAVQGSRMAAKRPQAIEQWIRRAMVWTLAMLVISGAGVFVFHWARERLAMASLPEGSAKSPNILLLVLDTVRSYSLSLYGYERHTTPRMEEWSRDAVRFDRAFVTAPWTLPSHAGMFTGRYPHELSSSLRVPLDDTYPTIAEALAGAGYATAGFAANLAYCTRQYGLARGFAHYEDFPVTAKTLLVSSVIAKTVYQLNTVSGRIMNDYDLPDRKSAEEINGSFLSWVDRAEGDRPFFAFINYLDAHAPHLPPPPFDTLFGPRPRKEMRWHEFKFGDLNPRETADQMAAYEGGIAYLDQQIDVLLKELRQRGILDNTVVIVTSDHGEHWGDHNKLSHGNSLYRQLLQVPLIIRYPARFPGGTIIDEPVSLVDLPVTLLDIAGVENKGRFPGRSMASNATLDPAIAGEHSPVLSGNSSVTEKRGGQSLIAYGLHYIRQGRGTEELYDLWQDPLDTLNLISHPDRPDALALLRHTMDSLFQKSTSGQKTPVAVAP